MYICDTCGEIFDEIACDLNHDRCPACDSRAFDEAVQCKGCGEWIPRMEAYGYSGNLFCKDCIDARKDDIDFLVSCTDDTEDVEVPALYRHIFSNDEIAAILYRAAKDRRTLGELDTSKYIDYYANDIAEALDTERRGK